MLPVTLAVESYSNHRFSESGTPDPIGLLAFASDQFLIFYDVTPAFPSGIGTALSLGDVAVSGQIRPKISGIQILGSLGAASAEVYFGNSIQILGQDLYTKTSDLYAEGQLVDNQAYPMGLFLEMRVGDLNVYLDQWEPYTPPTDVWEDKDKYDLFCEV